MSYKVLLFSVLLASLAAFGQTGASNQSSNPGQSWSNPAQPVPVGNGLSVTGGTAGYYGEGPVSGTLLGTPTATFDSPAPTAGISNAGRAGISNLNPVNTAVQSSLSSSTMVFSNVPPDMSTAVSPATSATSSERATSDLGPSFFSNQFGATPNNNQSLGEIAAHYQSLQPQGLRTYTNADVRPPKNIGASDNSVMAANMPPALGQSGTSTIQTSNIRPSAATPAAPVKTGESTEQGDSHSSQTELPATATTLPLLAFLGITSIGIGLLLRRKIRFVR